MKSTLVSENMEDFGERGRQMLVLGAGYIGEELCRLAIGKGMVTTALTRNLEKAHRLAGMGVRCIVADLADKAWHAQVPGIPDYVVNCVSAGGGGLEGYRRSYQLGMESVIAWALAAGGAGTFVYTSSTSVYPQGDGQWVDEDAPTQPATTERAEILLRAEESARAWPGRMFILRLSGIYGPGRHHLLDALSAGSTVLAGKGDHRLNLIHRDDVVSGIALALQAGPSIPGQVFNVTDDEAVTREDLMRWLSGRLKCPMPSFDGHMTSGRRSTVPDRMMANARIKRVLGWMPQFPSFREGYRRILEA